MVCGHWSLTTSPLREFWQRKQNIWNKHKFWTCYDLSNLSLPNYRNYYNFIIGLDHCPSALLSDKLQPKGSVIRINGGIIQYCPLTKSSIAWDFACLACWVRAPTIKKRGHYNHFWIKNISFKHHAPEWAKLWRAIHNKVILSLCERYDKSKTTRLSFSSLNTLSPCPPCQRAATFC